MTHSRVSLFVQFYVHLQSFLSFVIKPFYYYLLLIVFSYILISVIPFPFHNIDHAFYTLCKRQLDVSHQQCTSNLYQISHLFTISRLSNVSLTLIATVTMETNSFSAQSLIAYRYKVLDGFLVVSGSYLQVTADTIHFLRSPQH